MNTIDWVTGDLLNMDIPAHEEALREGGEAFLTEAFRAVGALDKNNHVTAITRIRECPGGSTGRKLLLSVNYSTPSPDLHTELFVKFSRDFSDEIRDRAKNQLEPEVHLALLSRNPGFPIAVPTCYFADYHRASGTGILITQSIPFGEQGIEPLYEKCLDYELPQPLEHYRAIFQALGSLAGTQKSGRLTDDIARHFPFDISRQAVNQPIRYNLEQLQRRIDKFAVFAASFSHLLPADITSNQFIERMKQELPKLLQQEQAIKDYLHNKPDFIALMHWNANIDNAWFWRDSAGELQCGLMDWGMVSQMNIASALWGALSAAELELWNEHLDELLLLFAQEYQRAGGPQLDPEEIKKQLILSAILLGLSWLMDAPAMIQREIPDLSSVENRFDIRFKSNESARAQLQMFSNVLNLWQRHDIAGILETVSGVFE